MVGSVKVFDVLMGFHQNQMSRQVIFLQTELNPCQGMLKPKFELDSLSDDSEDIYLQTKLLMCIKDWDSHFAGHFVLCLRCHISPNVCVTDFKPSP